jgi:hypothetical protein
LDGGEARAVNFASEQDGLAIEQKGKEGEDDSQLGLR